MVLDFLNEAETIKKAFQPYYEKTILSEGTDPNVIYDLENRLLEYHLFGEEDVNRFAKVYFRKKDAQDELYAILAPVKDRFMELGEDERTDFHKGLKSYVNLYAFLSQVMPFSDVELEKIYVFIRYLNRYLPVDRVELPREIQNQVDMDSFRIQETFKGSIQLERGEGILDPIKGTGGGSSTEDELEPLSQIIKELNERFGTDFTEEDKVFIQQLEERLGGDVALNNSLQVNPPEKARLTFDEVVTDRIQDMIDTNFKFYKRVTDDQQFAKHFLDLLFSRFLKKEKDVSY
jgi:type I restriction enzyme R subunit